MTTPLVTIGAINYNNSKYVIETLESIAAQTYSNTELLIVDDASTDDSLSKIKTWLSNYKKPYKLIVHTENRGVHAGYESVIKNSSGQYLSFIATDDLITPEKFAEQVEIFSKLDKNYGVVYGDIVEIDEKGKEINLPNFRIHAEKKKHWQLPQGDVFQDVVKEFLIYIQSTLIKAEYIKPFFFSYKALSEDWQLIMYLARHSRFYGVDKLYAKYRRHSVSLSTQNRRKERYFLWCESNTLMFYEAYLFPNNSSREKRVIADRLEFSLLDYAYQANSRYADVMRTWRQVANVIPATRAYKILIMIYWLRIKLRIKNIVLRYLSRQPSFVANSQ